MPVPVRLIVFACAVLGVFLAVHVARAHAVPPAAAPSAPAALPAAAPHTLITVTVTDDDFLPGNGTCSLREAVYAASHDTAADACPAGGADDTIQLGPHAYDLSRLIAWNEHDSDAMGDLDITGTLALIGTPATTVGFAVNQGDSPCVLEIWSGAVTIEHVAVYGGAGGGRSGCGVVNHAALTLRHARLSGFYFSPVLWNEGRVTMDGSVIEETFNDFPSITNSGQITVTNSIIEGTEGPYPRAGFVLDNKAGAVTTIYSSTIRNNRSWENGGQPLRNDGTMTLVGVTMALNKDGAITSTGVLTVTDSGFEGNGHWKDYYGTGGGITVAAGTATIERSTFKENTGTAGVDVYPSARAVVRDSVIDADGVFNRGQLAISGSEIFNYADFGSAIENTGVITVATSRIHHNGGTSFRAQDFGGTGVRNWPGGRMLVDRTRIDHNEGDSGGIRNEGTLVLRDSLVDGNRAKYRMGPWGDPPVFGGGGGGLANSGVFTITNSSLIANTGDFTGGAIFAAGGLLVIESSTIAFNHADVPTDIAPQYDVAGDGGGIFARSGAQVVVRNTLVAGNRDESGGGHDAFGVLTSAGHTLIGTTEGYTLSGDPTGNQRGVDPRLGVLADHGGATWTVDLRPGSPAIDAGAPSPWCPATDQRGMARPQDGDGADGARCDIGAYERQASEPEPTPMPTFTPTPTAIPTGTPAATRTPLPMATATATPTLTGATATPTLTPTATPTLAFRVYLPLQVR